MLGATSIVLTEMLQIDGETEVTMADFGSKGFATLEPGNGTQEEQISFTGIVQNSNGTATLTGVSNVLMAAPYTETSGTEMSHAGGVYLVISNTSGFYNRFANKDDDETIAGKWTFPNDTNTPVLGTVYAAPTTDLQVASKKYVDDVAIAGAPDATDTVKGITKLSVAAASPTDPIAAGTNDPRIPTQDENDALAGTSGTPSSTNKYVTAADTTGGNMPTGSIVMYGGTTAPNSGWLVCDGSSVLRASYANLFSLIGTTYGSADGTHFNVPDMRGRIAIGYGTGTGGGASGTGLPTGGSALTAVALGTWKGEETHTLTTPEIPSHTHTYQDPSGGSASPAGGGGGYANPSPNAGTASGATGGDGAHNNIQPVMGVNFIIKT